MPFNSRNGAPRKHLLGIKDQWLANRYLDRVRQFKEKIPMHLPHVFGFAPKGPREPQIVNHLSAPVIYGEEAFNPRSRYATHQTPLAEVLHNNENYYLYQRLVPTGATSAYMALSVEVVEYIATIYERDQYGAIVVDDDGIKVPTGEQVNGYRLRWIMDSVGADNFADRKVMLGTLVVAGDNGDDLVLTDDDDIVITEKSERIPIMDFKVAGWGAASNNVGIRLWAPVANRVSGMVHSLSDIDRPYIYAMELVERPRANEKPEVIYTSYGADMMNFTLRSDMRHRNTQRSLWLDDVIFNEYGDPNALPKREGPYSDVHVYHDNIEYILKSLYAREAAFNPQWPGGDDDFHRINLFTARDGEGNPYHTFDVLGVEDEGLEFSPHMTLFATGGNDGDISQGAFDDLVREQLENYGDLEDRFMDMGYWPQSIIYDTGFTMKTKRAFMVPVGRRKDLFSVFSTQDLSLPANTQEEDASMATMINSFARNYPESEIHGTDVVRAAIVPGSGQLTRSEWTKPATMTVALANAISVFMGDEDGACLVDKGFDDYPYNIIDLFRPTSVEAGAWKDYESAMDDWDNGMVSIIVYDRNRLMFASTRTVYTYEHSPLSNLINALSACELEKVAYRTWQRLLNGGKLTASEFLAKSDELFARAVQDRFDQRFVIEPRTFFTDVDAKNGYSWTTEVDFYAKNGWRLGTTSIISHQRADFYPSATVE